MESYQSKYVVLYRVAAGKFWKATSGDSKRGNSATFRFFWIFFLKAMKLPCFFQFDDLFFRKWPKIFMAKKFFWPWNCHVFWTKAVKMPRFGVNCHEIAIRTILLVLTFYLLIYEQLNDLVVNNSFRHRNEVTSFMTVLNNIELLCLVAKNPKI